MKVTPMELRDSLVIRCDCSCSYVGIDVWIEEDGSYELYGDFYQSAFAAGQTVRWKERLKLIWSALRGKEYSLNGIVLNRADAKRMRDFLASTLVEGRGATDG